MVSDAEKFKEEDEAMAKKITTRNDFENYCFQMKNTLDDAKLKEHFTNEDKKLIAEISSEGLQWLEGNQDAEADIVEGKKKEMEAKYNPIMMKVYQESNGQAGQMPGMPGGMPGAPNAGGAGDAGVDDLD